MGGGGKGSTPTVDTSAQEQANAQYEAQLAEQTAAREQAEAEAAALKSNQDAADQERKKRAAASYLTGGGGSGEDLSITSTKKTYLGSGA